MTFSRSTVALAIAGLLLLTGCANTSGESESESQALPASFVQDVRTTTAEVMAEYDVPGAVVSICAPGYADTVITEGLADTQAATPMTADLVWPIRSQTKSFTVTLILQLADEGKLSLDDTIDQYVAGVPNGDQITLRQLAEMTSGVPEYTTEAWLKDYLADETRNFTTSELIDYAVAEPAMFKPGKKAVYVNTSTLLLGQVVEEVEGRPFPEALQRKILDPLELTETGYPNSYDDWSGPHPTGYQPDDAGDLTAQDNNFTVFGPAGAMTSTVSDMCRWGLALATGELLDEDTQAARLQGQPLKEGPEYDSYGQGIGELSGFIGHTGEGFGHTVLVMADPETGTTAVINMNIAQAEKHVPTTLFRELAQPLSTLS
ncbi:MAG: beta-lactamase family protein [Actinomycetia bacterium]|nr:beta-lactamase family protein [Actinomycetes bacterium]